jgi:hypothetical protein
LLRHADALERWAGERFDPVVAKEVKVQRMLARPLSKLPKGTMPF